MRTKDVPRHFREFGKFIPAYAAYERYRLSLYREAAKEAESIIDRWEDELDEDEDYESGRVFLRLIAHQVLAKGGSPHTV